MTWFLLVVLAIALVLQPSMDRYSGAAKYWIAWLLFRAMITIVLVLAMLIAVKGWP